MLSSELRLRSIFLSSSRGSCGMRLSKCPIYRLHWPADQVIVHPVLKSFRIHRKCAVNDIDSKVDIFVGVREADHKRWRQDSAADQFLKKQRPKHLRLCAMFIHRPVNQIARPSGKLKISREPMARYGFIHSCAEPFSLPPKKLDHALLAENSYGFQRRRQRVRFCAMRGG